MLTDNYFNFSSSLYVICCENHNFNSLILILVHMWESKYTKILRVRESKTENVKECIQQEATQRSDGKSFSIRELEAVSNHNILNILLHKYLYF